MVGVTDAHPQQHRSAYMVGVMRIRSSIVRAVLDGCCHALSMSSQNTLTGLQSQPPASSEPVACLFCMGCQPGIIRPTVLLQKPLLVLSWLGFFVFDTFRFTFTNARARAEMAPCRSMCIH
jgi:hypothetical protein